MQHIIQFILPILLVVELWEIVFLIGFVSPTLFPPPSQVARALTDLVLSGVLWNDMRASANRLFLGVMLGSLSGIVLGLLTGRIKTAREWLAPVIQILRPLPPVAIIPLVIVWFGIGDGAKIFSIAFAVFFPVWVNAHVGAERVPMIYLWSARLLSDNRFKKWWRVIFPAALPFIVTGVRVGIAIGFIMVFVAELAGASSGLGYRIAVSHLAYRIDEMMAALVVLGAFGALADQLFLLVLRRAFPWLKFTSA